MVAPAGTTDVYVAKLAGDGTYITHKKGNAAAMTGCVGTSVAADDAGNVTVFGSFSGSIDFGAQPATSTPMGYDTFLVKLKADDWTPVWTKPFGKGGHQYGWGLTVAGDGSSVAVGAFYTELEVPPNMATMSTGGSDIFVVSSMP